MANIPKRKMRKKAGPDLGSVKHLLDVALDDGGQPDEISERARALIAGEVDADMGIVEIFNFAHPKSTPEENEQYRLDTLKCWHHHWSYAGPDVAAEIEAKYARHSQRTEALLDALLEINK